MNKEEMKDEKDWPYRSIWELHLSSFCVFIRMVGGWEA